MARVPSIPWVIQAGYESYRLLYFEDRRGYDVRSNSLETLPVAITSLTKLVELRLYQNNPGSFPENIHSWLAGLKRKGCKILDTTPGPEGNVIKLRHDIDKIGAKCI